MKVTISYYRDGSDDLYAKATDLNGFCLNVATGATWEEARERLIQKLKKQQWPTPPPEEIEI